MQAKTIVLRRHANRFHENGISGLLVAHRNNSRKEECRMGSRVSHSSQNTA
jgi:hypothetical protein